MTSRTFPIACFIVVFAIWIFAPNAATWGDVPTTADLMMVFFTLVGVITWELRDAAEWVVEQIKDK